MKLSPIAFFAYKRPEHTRKSLESLSQNEGAESSDLFIFCEGAKRIEDEEAVRQVRQVVRSKQWCGNVHIIEHEKNMGCANSIIYGVTKICEEYGSVIVLEDDMVTSPYFLTYMNESLEIYSNDDRVISIHGYIYPVKSKLPETFFLRGADGWGWATWQRGWKCFNPDGQYLLDELQKLDMTNEFDFNGTYGYTQMLKDQIAGKIDAWDIRWYASAFLEDKLTLYPRHSLVHNIGNDSSGTHCNTTSKFDATLSLTPIKVDRIEVKELKLARLQFENFFSSNSNSNSLAEQVYGWLKRQFIGIS